MQFFSRTESTKIVSIQSFERKNYFSTHRREREQQAILSSMKDDSSAGESTGNAVDVNHNTAEGQLVSERLLLKDEMIGNQASRIQDLDREVANLRELCNNYSQALGAKDAIIAQLTSPEIKQLTLSSSCNGQRDKALEAANARSKGSLVNHPEDKEGTVGYSEVDIKILRQELEEEREGRMELESVARALRTENDVLKARNMEYLEEKELSEERHARLLGKTDHNIL